MLILVQDPELKKFPELKNQKQSNLSAELDSGVLHLLFVDFIKLFILCHSEMIFPVSNFTFWNKKMIKAIILPNVFLSFFDRIQKD